MFTKILMIGMIIAFLAFTSGMFELIAAVQTQSELLAEIGLYSGLSGLSIGIVTSLLTCFD